MNRRLNTKGLVLGRDTVKLVGTAVELFEQVKDPFPVIGKLRIQFLDKLKIIIRS